MLPSSSWKEEGREEDLEDVVPRSGGETQPLESIGVCWVGCSLFPVLVPAGCGKEWVVGACLPPYRFLLFIFFLSLFDGGG